MFHFIYMFAYTFHCIFIKASTDFYRFIIPHTKHTFNIMVKTYCKLDYRADSIEHTFSFNF